MEDCVFCKIVAGKMPAQVVHEDDKIIAFRDINPQAPTHLLLVPKKHLASLFDVGPEQSGLLGDLILVANDLARKEGLADKGYRLVSNCGRQGGQWVAHVHFHLLGGRQLADVLG